jgi:membrane protease YdiL (CAAX protease family)
MHTGPHQGKIRISAAILLAAATGYYLKYFYAYVIFGMQQYNALDPGYRNLLVQATAFLICLFTAWALSSFSISRMLHLLGMDKQFFKALGIAALCALPMFIGGYMLSGEANLGLRNVFLSAIWPGINEEIIYRAFILGLLVKLAGWQFFQAILISSFMFAYGHIYQGTDMTSALMILAFTLGAGIGFSIFYRMWNWNIWFTVFLHMFMNMAFTIFSMGETALMTSSGNIFRGITLLLATIASVVLYRKHKKHGKEAFPFVVGINR